MELMQRICWNPPLAEKEVDMFLEMLERHPKACDNVWLSSRFGYPPMEEHAAYAKRLAVQAERIRKAGVSVSLQISNSIGHGDSTGVYLDCTGLVYEGSPVECLVGHDGVKAKYAFCWRGRDFKDYMAEQIRRYMVVNPDRIWIDDDIRPDNHFPVAYGCFCEDCIATFNEKHGASFDRESLVNEMLHGDKKWRKRYIEFIREGLYDFAYEMSEAVREISPETYVCIQNGPRAAYSGFDHKHILDAVKDATGKAPMMRPGGGTYDDHNPNGMLEKMMEINYQRSLLPDYVTRVVPEIENLPCLAFGKTPAGTAFETSLYFAAGYTDMSYSMLRYNTEELEWHMQEFRLFEEQRPYWEELTKRAQSTHQSGLRFFLSRDSWARDISENGDMKELNTLHFNRANLLLRDAIPMTFDEAEKNLYLLHPEMAQMMSDEEIKFLLTKNVITDGETLAILANRGYDLGMKAQQMDYYKGLTLREKMGKHPVNPEGLEAWATTFYVPGKSEVYYMTNPDECVEVVSEYGPYRVPVDPHTEDPAYPYGIATAVVKTAEGGKWGIFGYAPWKGVVSMKKRDQFLNMADYLSGNKLAARVMAPLQMVLLPRENLKGETVEVSLVNCTIGTTGEFELLVRRPVSEDFYYMSQTSGKVQLSYKKQGEDYIVTVPDMAAWTVGTVFCD